MSSHVRPQREQLEAVPEVPADYGYLAQPDMRALMQAALDLGWTLVPYEADFSLQPPGL
jgi:hypothetical protein